MYGSGVIKGMLVTGKHFLDTYIEDIRYLGRRSESFATRQGVKAKGVFTVQYPEERLPVPEEFRFIPFLVYEEGPEGQRLDRCTSCGICTKVCPPQCIWIVRSSNPDTGRPIPEPVEFFIDVDICMNCGLCAEYCPFDAIKMDHDFELSTYDRGRTNIFNKERLSRPVAYYASIRPQNYRREESIRAEKEAAKASKPA